MSGAGVFWSASESAGGLLPATPLPQVSDLAGRAGVGEAKNVHF